MQYKKLGPFITQVIEDDILLYTSRGLRKSFRSEKAISWWIPILFMIGAFCFGFSSFSSLYFSEIFSSIFINIIYFIGSIFFTAAAYLQYLESINSDITHHEHIHNKQCCWFWLRWRPYNLGYMSSLTQFIGTIFFNINTFNTLFNFNTISISISNMLGSILFLISAFFAYFEIYHDKDVTIFSTSTWWIIWINLLGSIFFQISAFFSWFSYQNIATLTTLLGALCFFMASFILKYENKKI